MTPAHDLYAAALERGADLVARDVDGRAWPLAVGRWVAPAGPVDERLLRRAVGPVLDVGCGPGRHVRALGGRGVPVLGIDTSAAAVLLARRHGTRVHLGSVFGPIPWSGRWRTALLLDGNVGIGGDPVTLLRRVAALLRHDGRVLCETDAPGLGLAVGDVRLEHAARVSAPFAWARVGAEALEPVALEAGLRVACSWDDEGRWFAELARRAP
jgi:SAM-dependent methyltransferase